MDTDRRKLDSSPKIQALRGGTGLLGFLLLPPTSYLPELGAPFPTAWLGGGRNCKPQCHRNWASLAVLLQLGVDFGATGLFSTPLGFIQSRGIRLVQGYTWGPRDLKAYLP